MQAELIAFRVMACSLIVAPMFAYPCFLMKALLLRDCSPARSTTLLIRLCLGLLSFGHALWLRLRAMSAPMRPRLWGFPRNLAIASGTVAAAGLA